jgi:response regulator of citrate/malate metabolism
MIQKILLIDDDEITNFFNRKLIKNSNPLLDINTVSSVKQAMDFLRKNKSDTFPDIIFLDIFMPVKNGWDFLEEFQNEFGKDTSGINLYMLSSSIYLDDITKANDHKLVKGYITKPLSSSTLNNILKLDNNP